MQPNARMGAAATILPGVTTGENGVVAAVVVVTREVPPPTRVAGIPENIIKSLGGE